MSSNVSARINYRVQPFGTGVTAEVSRDLASLHGALLSHSPVALLGPDFMSRFYYSVLPRMGLISGAVAYMDDRPAGFIVVTDDSSGFMQQAIRRSLFRIGWVMATSVLKDPKRIAAVWEALQIMRNLPPPDPNAPQSGEVLSFGVMPEFRAREFMIRTKLRISQDLLKSAMGQFADKKVTRARVIVDADNLEARLFYLGNGWQPGLDVVPGWRKKTVEFLWQPASAG
ncbi:ribosomal protein S18 acetylase RimI-like enzyme [Povalibacter uvarum]|uniref:Ribosomal protein S18 acetylase RimI-like enzyme n=1 Tax=Povalibacter uvarum TaxID=732238 RepID=A0A841HH54_9GAMM|nr:hypothetical protein [Povalibacter uvarum]MBB6091660.1 ribosomal protein S18 acetylase RimI-like enzyme [Povalibacter uvarum]